MSDVLPEIVMTEDPEEPEITEEEEDEIIEVVKKEFIPPEEIFKDPVVKPVKKEKKQLSQARLEQLAKAREKSNLKRKLEREEKDAEVEKILSQKKDEYVKKKVEKAVKKQVKEVDSEQVIVNNVSTNISPDHIQDIVSQSILKYDTQKKAEKVEKKKKKAVELENERINNTIRRAQGQPASLKPMDEGYFSQCF
tara:strand:+ start:5458 stop:6042 length:585 start_codon:yes stop_codon:yes gene_type:complete